jgi:hypothetical protein
MSSSFTMLKPPPIPLSFLFLFFRDDLPHDILFPARSAIQTAEPPEPNIDSLPFTFLVTDNIISIMGDGGEAFCLFCVFCGLKIRVFRAFRGS